MFYYGYHFLGMHILWWIFWLFFLCWIFLTPWYVPGRPYHKDTPLDILKRRLASGAITKEDYEERRKILEGDSGAKQEK
jgi:putative membrane protein